MAQTNKTQTDKVKTVNTRTTETVKNPKSKTAPKKETAAKKTTVAKDASVKDTKAAKSSKSSAVTKDTKPAKETRSQKSESPKKTKPVKNDDISIEELIVHKKKKKKGTALAVISCFFAVIILLYFIADLATPLFFLDFYKDAKKSAKIPGLNEAFVPQGFAYSDSLEAYLVCGYMSNSEPSRLYVVNDDGSFKELRLRKQNGDDFTGHAGGVATNEKGIYLSNDQKIFYLSMDTVKNAKDLETVTFEGSFEVPCRASFAFSSDNMLFVGEFYHDGYSTDVTHKLETADGEHGAFVFGYEYEDGGEFGVKDTKNPDVIYSVCNKVQGMYITDEGTAVLSTSYGLKNSELKIYDTKKATIRDFEYNGKLLPLYVLDSQCMEDTVTMPWGSEGIDERNGKILIGFEFGSKKYGGGLLPFAIENIMLYTIEK